MKITTLDEFIIQRQKDFPFATGELSGLVARHRFGCQNHQPRSVQSRYWRHYRSGRLAKRLWRRSAKVGHFGGQIALFVLAK